MPALTRVTEELTIDIAQCIPRNPVYIKWIGPNGGWNYWLFGCNQLEGLTTSTGGTFQKFIEDLQTADTDTDTLSRQGVPELTLHAENLIIDKFNGIKTVLTSAKIMMLLNPDTWQAIGEQWLTVNIAPAKYTMRDTKASLYKIEFIIQLPQVNSQQQ